MPTSASLAEVERLCLTRYRDLLRVATAITGSLDAGRDAIQEAFVTALRNLEAYRGDGTVEAWLWRIVVTSALGLNRSRRKITLERTWAPSGAPARPDEPDEYAEVRAGITRLPNRQRLVLFLRYYADLEYEAIAEALGIRPGTVAAALNSAHAKLHRDLKEVAQR